MSDGRMSRMPVDIIAAAGFFFIKDYRLYIGKVVEYYKENNTSAKMNSPDQLVSFIPDRCTFVGG